RTALRPDARPETDTPAPMFPEMTLRVDTVAPPTATAVFSIVTPSRWAAAGDRPLDTARSPKTSVPMRLPTMATDGASAGLAAGNTRTPLAAWPEITFPL